jgi:hypothetical protein
MDDYKLGHSAQGFSEIEYIRTLGAYKPKFEGISDDYFPLTGLETFKYSLLVLLTIGVTLGIMIGFLFWVINTNDLQTYINIWSGVFLFFVLAMTVLFYTGGKDRIRQEKKMIEQKQKKERELAGKLVMMQEED